MGLRNEKDRKNGPLWRFRTTAGTQEVEQRRSSCRVGIFLPRRLLAQLEDAATGAFQRAQPKDVVRVPIVADRTRAQGQFVCFQ